MTDRQAGVEEVPPGYKRTEVGMIPEDWSVSLLDSIAVRGSGHTPDKKHPEYWDGSIPWISLADSPKLDNGYIYETTSTITPAGIQNSSAVIHPPETVVLTRDAGVGKSAIMGQAMAVSQHFMAWRCGPNINNHFLYYWLQSKKGEFERIAIGNTIKTIGLPYFKNLKIPLPHIHEQYTIAATLSDVDGLIGALDALIEKKRAIKQAAMQQLLTGKKRLPDFEGEWIELNIARDSTLKARIGWQGLTTAEYLESGDYYLVTGTDFDRGRVDWRRCWFVDRGRYMQDKNIQLAPGDVLLTKDGTIGKAGFVDSIPKPATLNSGIFVIRPKADAYVPLYMYYVLTSQIFEDFLARLQAGSTISHLYQKDFVDFTFEAPSLDEQRAIAAVLSDMDAEIAALKRRREKAKQIKQGMMQQLLTGRIRLPSAGRVSAQ